MTQDLNKLLPLVSKIAIQAGEIIMGYYKNDFEVSSKNDASPVTDADRAAEEYITTELLKITPDIPVIGEEAVSCGSAPSLNNSTYFWLVDPLDGTKEFIKQTGEFTVNIALIKDDVPVLGIVQLPAQGDIYLAAEGLGAFYKYSENSEQQPIKTRAFNKHNAIVMTSKDHAKPEDIGEFLNAKGYGCKETIGAGSSLKFCLVARGKADLYPRIGTTMEWDTAAAHAVLKQAGGEVLTMKDEPLTYRKQNFKNPHFYAIGTRE